jgi:putative tricarboxylic transport membrane protein
MRFNDAVVGTAFLLIAGAMIAMTFTFPPFPGQKYGPSLFPRIIGGGIILFSLLLMLREWRAGGRPLLVLDGWARSPRRLASFALMLAAMLFYLVASEPLGFIPTGGTPEAYAKRLADETVRWRKVIKDAKIPAPT